MAKLSNRQIIELMGNGALGYPSALTDAHGRAIPVKGDDGKAAKGRDGSVAIDTDPYDLAPGARTALSLIMMKLRPVAEAFEQARAGLAKTYVAKSKKLDGEDKKWRDAPFTIAQHPLNLDYSNELEALLDKEVEIPRLPKVKYEDLKVNVNKIPPDVVARLERILDMTAIEKEVMGAEPEDTSPAKR